MELKREKTNLEKRVDEAMDKLQKLADEQFLMSNTRDELLALKERMRINYGAFYWASQMAEQMDNSQYDIRNQSSEYDSDEQCFATSFEEDIRISRTCIDEKEETEKTKNIQMKEMPFKSDLQ